MLWYFFNEPSNVLVYSSPKSIELVDDFCGHHALLSAPGRVVPCGIESSGDVAARSLSRDI